MNIQDTIDQSLKQEREERSKTPRSGKFSPSSFGKCFRAQIYNRRNTQASNDVDARTLRVFKAGNLFHDFVQNLVDGQNEVRVEEDDVLGFVDIVIDDAVIELKSQHSRAFWYMQQNKNESNVNYLKRIAKNKKPNILQSCYYAIQLGKEKIYLVYISKDDLCIRQFEFSTKEYAGEVKVELLELRRWWEVGSLPPPMPRAYVGKDGKSKECQYCNWKDLCKNG